MAEATVSFLLEKVAQVLTYYVKLATDAKSQLKLLQDDLSLLRAFVKEAGKRTKNDEPLMEMERQIRRVVHEVEDIVDSCLTQELAEKNKSSLRRQVCGAPKRVSLAEKVKDAREMKVKPVLERFQMIKLVNVPLADISSAAKEDKGEKFQLIREEDVVGFEDQENIIINYLMEKKETLDVISIVGMPGIGKTTLAWKIFQSKKIQRKFPTRIWVYILQEFNMREMLVQIMTAFTPEDWSHRTDEDLIKVVREKLKKGKFLLVMDDVWNEETWEAIKPVLPMNNPEAKVVITSRETRAGVRLNHPLRFLTWDESWELLRHEVFKGLRKWPDGELVIIGKRIAHNCDGLPLALVVMGGILQDHYNPEDVTTSTNAWEGISKNVSTYIGSRDKLQRVRKMVELSYNKLPDEQRDCFVYVGVFPEDYEIPVETLILLWIAEGFIQQKQGQRLEETGEEILKDLIKRNLLMVEKTNHIGQVKTCCVHDVIREFCKSKAAIGDLNLFQEMKFSKNGSGFYPPISDIHKYRRLCVHSKLSRFLSQQFNEPQGARSFLCFNDKKIDLPKSYIATIPDNFKLLRVLDSQSFKFHSFPIKVTNLIHLRYITLSCRDVTSLPEEISNLWNLQTLLVDTNSPTLEMKANIWKMFELRHLKSNAAIALPALRSKGAKDGENLQTLGKLSPRHCTQDVFDRACNLKRLGFRGDISLLMNAQYSLGKLVHLDRLKFKNDRFHEASENPHGLPKISFFPSNIKQLTLSATHLGWKHMPTLAEIGTLQVLKLKDNAFTGDSWRADGNGFPCLRFLLITGTNLVFWEVSNGHFPVLKCLVLRNCEKLTEIPLDLTKSLDKLDVDQVPKSAFKKIEGMKGLELLIGLQCK